MSENDTEVAFKRLSTAALIAAIGFAFGSICAGLAEMLKLFL